MGLIVSAEAFGTVQNCEVFVIISYEGERLARVRDNENLSSHDEPTSRPLSYL